MSSVVISGDTSGTVTLQAPATAGSTVLTLPSTSGTVVVTGGAQTIEFADGSASTPSITNSGNTNTGMFFPAADTIAFSEGGVEAMRLDSSGNVGIGTSSPVTRFHVNGASDTASGVLVSNQGTNVAILSNEATWLGTGSSNNAAVSSFGATALLLGTNGTERMRIDSSGNVLIGLTSSANACKTHIYKTVASDDVLRVQNATGSTGVAYVGFRYGTGAGTETGYISTNGTTTSYNTSSDYRLKENIASMTGALDKVVQLKPVTYKWIADGSNGQGFIAHELQEIIPDCVTGEKDAVETYTDEEGNEQTRPKYQGVDTSFLVATLTAAIQEQQTIINDLTARITALEAK
jgi:hypothetical protein